MLAVKIEILYRKIGRTFIDRTFGKDMGADVFEVLLPLSISIYAAPRHAMPPTKIAFYGHNSGSIDCTKFCTLCHQLLEMVIKSNQITYLPWLERLVKSLCRQSWRPHNDRWCCECLGGRRTLEKVEAQECHCVALDGLHQHRLRLCHLQTASQ